ncbi:MAG: iron-sulfur cluster carrier protein ApbC, partial [Gammaproteobacteria bacterium]|nr:iron-sulfur cluster carrier protein ApbC [Gammaproteobacteria bacterium]
MFNWFKSGKTEQLPDAVQLLLQHWQLPESGAPLALLLDSVSLQKNRLIIRLKLPLLSIAQPLQQALAEAGFNYQLTLEHQLTSAPVFKDIKHIILVASGKGGVG